MILVLILFASLFANLFIFSILQQERENPTEAVYANISELKKLTPRVPPSSTSTCSSPGLPLTPAPDSPEWEGRPEQDNGKMFYPTTHPQSPTLPSGTDTPALPFLAIPAPSVPAPSSLPPTLSQESDWEKLLDETTGRHYYYNATLNQTSWAAPEPLSPHQEGPVRSVRQLRLLVEATVVFHQHQVTPKSSKTCLL